MADPSEQRSDSDDAPAPAPPAGPSLETIERIVENAIQRGARITVKFPSGLVLELEDRGRLPVRKIIHGVRRAKLRVVKKRA